MADSNLTILIITLNVNGLHTSIKRQRLSEWIKDYKNPAICCLGDTHFNNRQTKNKLMGTYHENSKRKTGFALLTLGTIDMKTNSIIREKEELS